ncbi:MAG: type VII toxin-antitoxin system HepT family RNase toxin [Candidatus Humimicrobiaceae bacterium]
MDKILIQKKLNDLNKNIKLLEELKHIPLGQLSDSLRDQWAIFYGLQISIQIIIDIGNHILASVNENKIEDYADIIEKMGKKGIIPDDFAKKIRGMPGLRNILVHEYGIVDIRIIYNILQQNLSDFKDFFSYINKYSEVK